MMENIIRTVALERSGEGSPPRVWMAAFRELKAMGWEIDKRYPEPTAQWKLVTDPNCDIVSYKHYRDPETGLVHRGLLPCYNIVYNRWEEGLAKSHPENWEHLHDYDPDQTLPDPIFDYWYRLTTTFLEQSGVRRFLLWLRT